MEYFFHMNLLDSYMMGYMPTLSCKSIFIFMSICFSQIIFAVFNQKRSDILLSFQTIILITFQCYEP